MSHYILYGRPNSGSFAVQVALEEIGAAYERISIPFESTDAADWRAINPTGKVPALALPDGTLVFESAAILIHLASAHPEAHLAPPPGTSAHARFLQWMIYLSANVYEADLRIYYSERYSARGAADAEAIRERAMRDCLAQLEFLGRHLEPYLLGAAYSIADVYLYMLASWYPPDPAASHARIPRLGEHARLLRARPAIVKVEDDHRG